MRTPCFGSSTSIYSCSNIAFPTRQGAFSCVPVWSLRNTSLSCTVSTVGLHTKGMVVDQYELGDVALKP